MKLKILTEENIRQICNIYKENVSITNISKKFNTSEKNIKNILQENNILKPYFLSKIDYQKCQSLLDKKYIENMWEASTSNLDFFKSIDVGSSLGNSIIKFYNLKKIPLKEKINEQEILDLYFEGYSKNFILKKIGISRTSLDSNLSEKSKKILNFNFPNGKIKKDILKIIRNNDKKSLEEIISNYSTLKELTEYLGCKYITFYKILKHFNLDLPTFTDPKIIKNINSIKNNYIDYKIEFSNDQHFTMIHNKCGNEFSVSKQIAYLYNKKDKKDLLCPYCFNKFKRSSPENDISNFLESLNLQIIKNHKIDGKEIDILIPKYNIAVEFNGLYWHSDIFKDKYLHQEKYLKCKNNGIQLLTIFEDEWYSKQQIIKNMLLHKLHHIKDKIYARNTTISEIDNITYKNFLELNHIQGYIPSKFKYGLIYDNSLVGVLGLSRPNISSGYKNSSLLEIKRFATSKAIIGGFSKLLKHHLKSDNRTIITYSDLRYGNGNVYLNNGFSFEKMTEPNYFWTKGQYRIHRYNFTKHKLIEKYPQYKDLTENEIMRILKYNKIYDCGANKFILKN